MPDQILTRKKAVEFLTKVLTEYGAWLSSLYAHTYIDEQTLNEPETNLAVRAFDFNKALNSSEYTDGLVKLDNEGLRLLLLKCYALAEGLGLACKTEYSPDTIHITDHWEDNGNGSYTAQKGATLWELFGDNWKKLSSFERSPEFLHPGDIVFINKQPTGSIEPEIKTTNQENNTKDISTQEIIFNIGNMALNYLPCFSKYSKSVRKFGNIIEILCNPEKLGRSNHTGSLSLYLRQFHTEGQQEDGMEFFLTFASLLPGPVGFIASLNNFSIPEHKYEIVTYGTRPGFISGARNERNRIRIELLTSDKLNEMNQAGNTYRNYLKSQNDKLYFEIGSNQQADQLQVESITYSMAQHGMNYTEQRQSVPESYVHGIDYYAEFKKERRHIDE